ncbi:MAG: hypothetical protein ACE5HJ_06565 [Thermoplasmata archaeon]
MRDEELMARMLKAILEAFSSTMGEKAAYGIASRALIEILNDNRGKSLRKVARLLPTKLLEAMEPMLGRHPGEP